VINCDKLANFDDSYHLFSAYDCLVGSALGTHLIYMTAVSDIVEGSAMHQTQCKKRDKMR
jgi:hypothetical protein